MAQLYKLNIAGTDRTAYCRPSSVSIERTVDQRAGLSFGLCDVARLYVPTLGQTVIIYDDDGTTKRFAGMVTDIEQRIDETRDALFADCRARDWNVLADRRIVQGRYTGQTPGYIFRDLVANHLAADGVTATVNVEEGTTIAETISFDYCSATEAFNRLAQLQGLIWWIDFEKALHVTWWTTSPAAAAFEITDDSENWRTLRMRQSLEGYRNVQYVRATVPLAATRTETFYGDGASRTFYTKFPMSGKYQGGLGLAPMAPKLTVNGTPQTVGLLGSQWNYYPHTRRLVQDDGEALLTESDECVITYNTDDSSMLTMAQDATAITARVAVEGQSGKWDAIEDASDLVELAAADLIAEGLLDRYAVVPTELEGELIGPFPAIGTVVTVDITQPFTLSDDLVIQSVTSTDEQQTQWRHRIRATSGMVGDWRAAWKALDSRARRTHRPQIRGALWSLAETVSGVTNPGAATGTAVANTVWAPGSGHTKYLKRMVAKAKTAPTGAAAIIELTKNDAVIATLTIPENSTDEVYTSTFTESYVNDFDRLNVNITQVGSTQPGKDISVQLEWAE